MAEIFWAAWDKIKGYFFGTTHDYFSSEELERYSNCTYLSDAEINKLYAIFASLSSDLDSEDGDPVTRLSFETIQSLPELIVCPFAERLCEVFSTDPLREGLDFEDFMNMMSAFGHRAPWNLKAAYAFQIFDYNEDLFICANDIELTINCLTDGGHGIEKSEIQEVIKLIFKEVETVTDNEKISYTEFEHMMATAPDFPRLFRIPIV